MCRGENHMALQLKKLQRHCWPYFPFFFTQPLVWRIQLFDWWTILFALLTLAVLVLLITCRCDKENVPKYEDTEEDFL